LAGAGIAARPGKREPLHEVTLMALQKNLQSLHFKKIGISIADFGNVTPAYLTTNLKGVPLWISP
jgi:hypothetical protein